MTATAEEVTTELIDDLVPPCSCVCHEFFHQPPPPAEWVLVFAPHPLPTCANNGRIDMLCDECKNNLFDGDDKIPCKVDECPFVARVSGWFSKVERL